MGWESLLAWRARVRGYLGARGRAAVPRSERRQGLRSGGAAEPAAVVALVVLAVLAAADRRPPPLVLAVPVDRLGEPLLEAAARLPAELAHLVGRQAVATVVPGPVGHVLDQRLVAAGQREDASHHVDVRRLVRAADVVDLARQPVAEHRVDRAGEVLDVEPVAHLATVAVDGQLVAR